MKKETDNNKERVKVIIKILNKEYPKAKTKLLFKEPFQLLIATILSAQCTDERVNVVTKELFKKYKKPKDFATAKISDLEKYIYSTGFYQMKAKNIKACSKSLIDKFKGVVPNEMEKLTQLEGVGRKTANVILGSAFGKPAIPVDTHVKRLSNLLQFSNQTNPDKIELELSSIINKKNWTLYSDLMMAHGRKICIARKPKCELCKISEYCPSKQ